MNCEPHDNSDSMMVWLSEDDVDQLLDAAKDTERRIAFALGARCGLRSHEILEVSPDDLVELVPGCPRPALSLAVFSQTTVAVIRYCR